MNRLRQLRNEANESQEFVGSLIGVSGQAVGKYELGTRGLSQEKLIILAEHYNCSIDYLIGRTNIRNYEQLEIDKDKLKIGLSTKDYENITGEQEKQIEEFAKYVLKDNKKKNKKDGELNE